jgi:hypothetical protein
MAHGISRHVVRFVRFNDRVYALKATGLVAAQSEYRVLRDMRDDHLPVVEPVGVVSDAPNPGDAVLITRYLDFSLPYWYLLGRGDQTLADRLMDAGVVLLVRLHLEGVFWGDCSLSNILWRRDAGAMMAYLVDAETTERHATIGDRMRRYDLDIAVENVAGGLLELQASGRITEDIDPLAIAESLRDRYEELWNELTRVDEFDLDERWRIEQRVRRINELGFDVEELSINRDGRTLSVKPVLIEEGHHARELRQPHRARGPGEPGASSAGRHRPAPCLAGARRGAVDPSGRGHGPVARRGVPAGRRRDPSGLRRISNRPNCSTSCSSTAI